jgi:hypothetical protein
MQCRACSAEIPDGKRFCRMCGAPAGVAVQPNLVTSPSPVPPATKEASDRKCKACGAFVKEGKRFCGGCGTPAEPGPSSTDPEQAKKSSLERETPSAQPLTGAPSTQLPPQPSVSKGAERSGSSRVSMVDSPSGSDLAGEPETNQAASTSRFDPAPARKRFGISLAAGCGAVVILAFGAFLLWSHTQTQPQGAKTGKSAVKQEQTTASAAGSSAPSRPLPASPNTLSSARVETPHPVLPEPTGQSRAAAPRRPVKLAPSQPPSQVGHSSPPPASPPVTDSVSRAPEVSRPAEPAQSVQATMPAPAPRAPYTGDAHPTVTPPTRPPARAIPHAGYIVWRGNLDKNAVIQIDGNAAMPGSIDTGLPGVPVTIDLDTKNFAMVEFPSSSNGYRRMRIRSRNKVQSIILKWQLAD